MVLDVANQIEKLAITVRPVADLLPYAKNSRLHSPDQIALIAKLITEFGWTNPVLTDGKNGIVAGHGRVMAAKRLGLKRVPTIDLSHLTEEQKQAYVIADNRSAEWAAWSEDLLVQELGELAELGYDLTLTGWTQKDLEALLHESDDAGGSDEEPDRAPDLVVPLMIEVSRRDFERWKKFRAGRGDVEAFLDALTQLEVG